MKKPEAVVMMENHDQAYHAWKERGIRRRIVVHVDAHIDFGWMPELDMDELPRSESTDKSFPLLNPYCTPRKKLISIGNYICPAMQEGMVRQFYWVVPEASLRCRRGTRHILRQLKRILAVKRYCGGKLRRSAGDIRCRILDCEVIVCSLENLPRFEEPVVLDIDVDFLLTRFIWDDLNPRRLPWMHADELIAQLEKKLNDIDLLTIAYSVEGGFTPLRFKYLGDEIRALAQGSRPKAMQCKKEALGFERRGRCADACAAYERALQLDHADASAYYNLFVLRQDAVFLDRAVSSDRSYSTRYNNYGILYLRNNELKRAQREYAKLLGVGAGDAAVLNGLGHIALARRRYSRALEFFDRSLAADALLSEARFGKAIVLFKQGRLQEAQALFEGLKGDCPDEQETYWWLGRIAHRRGNVSAAIDNYKNAVMRAGEGPLVHCLLALLYLKKNNYFRVLEELKRAVYFLRIGI